MAKKTTTSPKETGSKPAANIDKAKASNSVKFEGPTKPPSATSNKKE